MILRVLILFFCLSQFQSNAQTTITAWNFNSNPNDGTIFEGYYLIVWIGKLAGALGFEPRVTGPKPVALPLGHAPIHQRQI